MSRVITFSRSFQKEPTYFVEKFLNTVRPGWQRSMAYFYEFEQVNEGKSPEMLGEFWNSLDMSVTDLKLHTIRGGSRFRDGDYFSPRVWSGKPRHSPQIVLCSDIRIPWVQPIELPCADIDTLAFNDGLTPEKFLKWFKHPEPFQGQIICWVESLKRYTL